MRTGCHKNHTKSSWPKIVVRKWLNIKSRADEFHSDYATRGAVGTRERRKSCSDDERYVFLSCGFQENPKGSRFEPEGPVIADTLDLRMFVGTWNVGGKSPDERLNLTDWLRTPAPSDIYVLGFQEIVPLNAGNVLGAEDNGPATKWLSLIRRALNDSDKDQEVDRNNTEDTTDANCKGCSNAQLDFDHGNVKQKPRISFSDLLSMEDELDTEDFERICSSFQTSNSGEEDLLCLPGGFCSQMRSQYCLAASKQMVGIFLCVWVRSDLSRCISNLKVSCVGRGIMGYLGNKGSISISMTLHQTTTFCFVCTHLTSGEKEGDEVRRNSDVVEILKRTRFPQSNRDRGGREVSSSSSPDNILGHDKIIWLGDLNYRLASTCEDDDTHQLLKKNDWQALLEKDQLRIEQRAGRVFSGWEEGVIYFAPTYKYIADSDDYVLHTSNSKSSKQKRRTPAWCDRILWKGEGVKQMWYMRGESRFSDHRPVYSLFSVQLNVANNNRVRVRVSTSTGTAVHAASRSNIISPSTLLASMSSSCITRVQAEELLLLTREHHASCCI
ncbi:PREDICTED: type I inositol polyphosphate 5-phosphatase 8-like isoform X2 [Nelumbo nucifera]|uniref:Type I inositol polyphosphate 5-phosphatase 8-like isoform X2 n=1 Tax=Nelumbo nucifera TaxID=4432 RepID=A0A1U8AD15_NELNU|nr:PREDICTED: type I inositol polyphosphate 5-phosphatase 8-like isoform X2 [Nelumbo nucifera]